MKESKYLYRSVMELLIKWVDRKEIFAIKGPRQAGKTTVLEMLREYLIEKGVDKDHIFFLNFEDRTLVADFTENCKRFVSEKINDGKRYFFFMDEYHYVPDGGQKLKLLFDMYKDKIKFIISGSSSLELASKIGKYLVGRVFMFDLFPLSFYEFLLAKDELLAKTYAEKHDALIKFLTGQAVKEPSDWRINDLRDYFNEYICFGGYPEVVKTPDIETKKKILNEIYNTYISKDVVDLLKVTDAFKYINLIKTLAARLGGLLNYEELSSSCKSYYKEISQWISILSETYIIKLVWPFFSNISTELRKTPKVYFYDLGLRNLLLNNFGSLSQRSDAGEILENFVLLSLLHVSKDPSAEVNYWRTTAKTEVDFVLDRKTPIEVKSKSRFTRSFRSFLNNYKPERGVVAGADSWSKSKVEGTDVLFVPVCYF